MGSDPFAVDVSGHYGLGVVLAGPAHVRSAAGRVGAREGVPCTEIKTDQSYSSTDLPDHFSMTCHPCSYINTVQFSTTRENHLFPCLYRDVVKGQRCPRREMLWEEGGREVSEEICHERREVSEERFHDRKVVS